MTAWSRRRWLGSALACPGLLVGCESEAAVALSPDFEVGVCNHLAHGRGTAERSLADMAELGANSFRDDAFWSQLETRKNMLAWPTRFEQLGRAIDLADARGMRTLLVLAYENALHHSGRYPIDDAAQAAFVRYAQFVARTFAGRVRYLEVWNEWDQHGDPRDYARLLSKVYPAIKQIDPNFVVVGGAVEGAGKADVDFILTLAEHGALSSMDMLSVHPYVFWRGDSGTPQALHRWLEDLQARLAPYRQGQGQGQGPMPLLLTEIGWPTAGKLGIPPARAANYLSQTLLTLRSLPYVHGAWWYNLYDKGRDASDQEMNFGLLTEDEKRKPPFDGFASVARLVQQARRVERLPTNPSVWALRFEVDRGGDVLALWSSEAQPGRWTASVPGVTLSVRNARQGDVSARASAQDSSWRLDASPLLLELPAHQRSVPRLLIKPSST
jgi:polysaccharide biosynthesis protein PslG